MEPITLYLDMYSPSSTAVLALILFNKLPVDIKDINAIMKDPAQKEEYKKLNPTGSLPLLHSNSFFLTESHAILRYLCNTCPVAKHWYPEDPKQRATIDSYLEWHNSHTKKCSLYFMTFYAHIQPRAYFSWDAAEEKKNVVNALTVLENVNLKHNKFIASEEEMTIADLSAISEIIRIRNTKIDFEAFPKVHKWFDECMKYPQLQKANKGPIVLMEKATAKLHL